MFTVSVLCVVWGRTFVCAPKKNMETKNINGKLPVPRVQTITAEPSVGIGERFSTKVIRSGRHFFASSRNGIYKFDHFSKMEFMLISREFQDFTTDHAGSIYTLHGDQVWKNGTGYCSCPNALSIECINETLHVVCKQNLMRVVAGNTSTVPIYHTTPTYIIQHQGKIVSVGEKGIFFDGILLYQTTELVAKLVFPYCLLCTGDLIDLEQTKVLLKKIDAFDFHLGWLLTVTTGNNNKSIMTALCGTYVQSVTHLPSPPPTDVWVHETGAILCYPDSHGKRGSIVLHNLFEV
jgi:hypothetical protein